MSNRAHLPTHLGPRIVVIGTTGSGKTTLARQLAILRGCRHIELDALHWEPGWEAAPLAVFRARVATAIRAEHWVLDGNYSKTYDLVWGRATAVVWLDYSLAVILRRLARRTLRRLITRSVQVTYRSIRLASSTTGTTSTRCSLIRCVASTFMRSLSDPAAPLAIVRGVVL